MCKDIVFVLNNGHTEVQLIVSDWGSSNYIALNKSVGPTSTNHSSNVSSVGNKQHLNMLKSLWSRLWSSTYILVISFDIAMATFVLKVWCYKDRWKSYI